MSSLLARRAVGACALTVALACAGAWSPPAFASPPNFSESFGASSVPLNGITSLTFVISNPNGTGMTSIGFTDGLPPGLVVSGTPNLDNGCNGTASANSGSTFVSLSGGSLVAHEVCLLSLDVTGLQTGRRRTPLPSDRAQGPTQPRRRSK